MYPTGNQNQYPGSGYNPGANPNPIGFNVQAPGMQQPYMQGGAMQSGGYNAGYDNVPPYGVQPPMNQPYNTGSGGYPQSQPYNQSGGIYPNISSNDPYNQGGYGAGMPQGQGGYGAGMPQSQGGYAPGAPQGHGGYAPGVPQGQGGYAPGVPQGHGGYTPGMSQGQGGYAPGVPQGQGGYNSGAPQGHGGYGTGGPQAQTGYGIGGPQSQPGYNQGGNVPPSRPQIPPQGYTPSVSYPTNLPVSKMDGIGASGEYYKGTIKPSPNFNAEHDSNVLKKAMKGLGTDEKAIIECLGRRSLDQRLQIKLTFKTMYGKDLIDELKSELSGKFSRAVVESLYDTDYYDAYSLHRAMEGAGTRENVLTEILTSRSNSQIVSIKDHYKKWFKSDLEKEVVSETSSFYKRVLVSCLQANKKELTAEQMNMLRSNGPNAVVDTNLANQDAQELYNAGEKKLGTDEACFIRIFAMRNRYQLKATFDAYNRLSGRDIMSSIDREMSGDLASSLKALAMLAINPSSYFATRLHKTMKGAGTNDGDLIRIILTRSEIDLENIKMEFQKMYGKTLASYVAGDTSGDYLKFLMRFVEGN